MIFQFHITVEKLDKNQEKEFIQFCEQEGVKTVLIRLEKGDYIEQPMFTRLIDAETFQVAQNEIKPQIQRFIQKGFAIRRIKAECDPRQNEAYIRPENYYEWHCLVEYNDEVALQAFCSAQKAHLSRNALVPGRKYVTIRLYDRDEFYQQVQQCAQALKVTPFSVIKEKFEYSVYDSFLTLDHGWA